MNYHYAETLVKVENVSLSYGEKQVLKSVNAEIKNIVVPGKTQGQVVGFLGPSGIGKTQLFRILAGLNRPTSGKVLINDTFMSAPVPFRAAEAGGALGTIRSIGFNEPSPGDVGVVAQNYPLFEHRTVLSNLMLAAARKEPDVKKAREKVLAMVEEFHLSDRINAYPAQLSGGQRQRCAILQQILCSGHFLLMDEPFSGLDLMMLEKTIRLITQVASMHELNTIIVITHDVVAAALVAQHIWLMGRDTDAEGKKLPGARIVKEYDLIERGLCWNPAALDSRQMADFLREVRSDFHAL